SPGCSRAAFAAPTCAAARCTRWLTDATSCCHWHQGCSPHACSWFWRNHPYRPDDGPGRCSQTLARAWLEPRRRALPAPWLDGGERFAHVQHHVRRNRPSDRGPCLLEHRGLPPSSGERDLPATLGGPAASGPAAGVSING